MTDGDRSKSEEDARSSQQPRIFTNFSEYEPPFDIVSTATRMIASIPAHYLFGLSTIVFTNMDCLSRKRRRGTAKSRKRKVRIADTAGVYHGAWRGEAAWVEVFVDQTFKHTRSSGWMMKVPAMREVLLSNVLFHEIGHHIHATVGREFRENEDVAEDWRKKLQQGYYRARYPWLIPVAYLLRPLLGMDRKNGT